MQDDNFQPKDMGSSKWQDDVGGLGTPPSTPPLDAPSSTSDDQDMPIAKQDDSTFSPPSLLDSSHELTSFSSSSADDLLDIKTKALSQLSPIVGHLDQTPEEKFKTTMMMIQASDNQDLIKDAYAAAQQITDEKVKAQALLDVVNEINYFTRQAS